MVNERMDAASDGVDDINLAPVALWHYTEMN